MVAEQRSGRCGGGENERRGVGGTELQLRHGQVLGMKGTSGNTVYGMEQHCVVTVGSYRPGERRVTYIDLSSHYTVHLKLMTYCVSTILQIKKKTLKIQFFQHSGHLSRAA